MNRIFDLMNDNLVGLSVFFGIQSAGIFAHELGHKWTLNAAFPGIAGKIRVGFFEGRVELNTKYHNYIVNRSLDCKQTRWQIAKGIAAGPIAGALFQCTVLYAISAVNRAYPNLRDNREMQLAQVSACVNMGNNIGNLLNIGWGADGRQLLSLFRNRIDVMHPYFIKELENNKEIKGIFFEKYNIPPNVQYPLFKKIHSLYFSFFRNFFITQVKEIDLPLEEVRSSIKLSDLFSFRDKTRSIYRKIFLKEIGFSILGNSMHGSAIAVCLLFHEATKDMVNKSFSELARRIK